MKKYTVSKHGKQRVRQRSKYATNTEINKLFKLAMKYGKTCKDFNPPFLDYLKNKQKKGAHVKVFKELIFVYKGSVLITAYEIPEKYQKQLTMEKNFNLLLKEVYRDGGSKSDLVNVMKKDLTMLLDFITLSRSTHIKYDENKFKELKHIGGRCKIAGQCFNRNIKNEKQGVLLYDVDDANITVVAKECLVGLDKLKNMGTKKKNKSKGIIEIERQHISDLLKTMNKCIRVMKVNNYYMIQNQK